VSWLACVGVSDLLASWCHICFVGCCCGGCEHYSWPRSSKLAVGGTVVTIGSYSAAGATGVYVVAWGAIVFGTISLFRELCGWLKTRMR